MVHHRRSSAPAAFALVAALAFASFAACGGGGGGKGTPPADAGSGADGGSPDGGGGADAGSDAGATLRTVTVNVTGLGTVKLSDGTSCTGSGGSPPGTVSCTTQVADGTALTLTGDYGPTGWIFRGFTGGCTGSPACTAAITADTTIDATFELFQVGANAYGVAVTPDGAKAYVALSSASGAVQVVNLPAFTLGALISVSPYATAVAVSPGGATAVVTSQKMVSFIDVASDTVAHTVSPPCAADTLYDVRVTPDGASALLPLLAGNCTTSTLGAISLSTYAVSTVATFNTSVASQGVGITPDGATAFVTFYGANIVKVAMGSGAASPLPGTSAAAGLAFPSTGDALVSGSPNGFRLSAAGAVGATISFDSGAATFTNVAVTSDGATGVIAGDFDTAVVNLASNSVSRNLGVGGRAVAITPGGKLALITSNGALRAVKLP